MAEIDDRVGVILRYKVDELNVRFLGYGVYQGKFKTPAYPSFRDIFRRTLNETLNNVSTIVTWYRGSDSNRRNERLMRTRP